jgi:peroxiredoxin
MRLTFLSLILLTSFAVFSQQQGYKLNFKINGLKDTTIYLGYYYGESTYIKDTARVNTKGEFVFEGKQPLVHGGYFLVLQKTRLFEMFLVGDNQKFTMQTDTADYIKNMEVTGDLDNKLFFENMLFNVARHKDAEPYLTILKDSTATEDKKKEAREAFAKINEKVVAYQDELIAKHPKTLTATVLKAHKPVAIPDPPKKADGTIDSTFQLKWYRQHFFDNFDLANEALIRMPRPMYQEKIYEYLDKLYAPHPDSLKKAIDFVVSKAKPTQETYKYAVWMCVVKYQQPEIMGLDAVYVHLYDTYFATGQMDFWINDKMRSNLKEQATRIRKSLIGNTAPNLIMLDSDLKPRSMYDIKNKYTILFIFDPDCGHCKEETPVLVDFYNKNKKKFDLEVFAVSTDTSMVKMKDFIKKMGMPWITVNGPRSYVGTYQDHYDAITTPSLFIIDNKKKIIGKKIPTDKIEDFLNHHEKVEKLKTPTKSAP